MSSQKPSSSLVSRTRAPPQLTTRFVPRPRPPLPRLSSAVDLSSPPPATALLYLPSAAQVVYRTSKSGRQLAIPQAERYAGRDWAHILWATPNSVVLRRIRNPLLWNVAWSLVVAVVQTRLNVCSRKLASVHGLLGSALGLLLVFRTNAAYQVSRVSWERKDSKGKEVHGGRGWYGTSCGRKVECEGTVSRE